MSRVPQFVLFEDDAVGGLQPLTWTRPAFELRSGALNLRERIQWLFPDARIDYRVRDPLRDLTQQTLGGTAPDDGPVVWVNARLGGSLSALADLLDLADGEQYTQDGALALACAPGSEPPQLSKFAEPLPAGVTLYGYAFELVHHNALRMKEELASLAQRGLSRQIFGVEFQPGAPFAAHLDAHECTPWKDSVAHVFTVQPDQIWIGPDVTLKPGVVLDAADGPIVMAAGVVVHAGSVVRGPCYLGPGTTINPGAKIREGTSTGVGCKLGGEVEDSVVLDLSNKQHDGFLGHAYVGSWVNLGADTNASDLKNNYGPVRIDFGEGRIDTGERFVGPSFGDHAKTGINTMLSTGAVLGVAANIFGGGFPPAYLPAFVWGGAEGIAEYRVDRAIDTARVVMERRQVKFLEENRALLAAVFASTQARRDRVLRG